MIKAIYDSFGDGQPPIEVIVVGWDRDRYYAYHRVDDPKKEILYDKCWKFNIRKNKRYALPDWGWDGAGEIIHNPTPTRKDIAKELKEYRKKAKTYYTVWDVAEKHSGEYRSLKKVLGVIRNCKEFAVRKDTDWKNGFSSKPYLVYTDEGKGHYENVNAKTQNWFYKNILKARKDV